jgi:hypothetical protein
MNLNALFLSPDIAAGRQLVERLGKLHLDWAGAQTAGDGAAATRDLFIAEDLVKTATVHQLRAAALIASEPRADRPVPVVPGPDDVAAIVGLDEVLAMLGAYAHACIAVGAGQPAAKREAERAYGPLREALERLFASALVYELHQARARGEAS